VRRQKPEDRRLKTLAGRSIVPSGESCLLLDGLDKVAAELSRGGADL